FGLVLGASNKWYPFTPTYTSVKKKWVGWPDIFRWFFSGIFLFILPFSYIGSVGEKKGSYLFIFLAVWCQIK
ncbi:MAG: hypothetical protein J7M20_09790, partial [Deltaproteobacteria bacterium]|nr:hypothetical protein [Deltaproteobacteria bacterium]